MMLMTRMNRSTYNLQMDVKLQFSVFLSNYKGNYCIFNCKLKLNITNEHVFQMLA